MADDMHHIVKWHNGTKDWSPFSDQEMTRRQNDLRSRPRHPAIVPAL